MDHPSCPICIAQTQLNCKCCFHPLPFWQWHPQPSWPHSHTSYNIIYLCHRSLSQTLPFANSVSYPRPTKACRYSRPTTTLLIKIFASQPLPPWLAIMVLPTLQPPFPLILLDLWPPPKPPPHQRHLQEQMQWPHQLCHCLPNHQGVWLG